MCSDYKIKVGAFILRTNEQGKDELLIHGFQSSPDSFYRVPGGGVEKGEELEHALMREIQEETGLFQFTLIKKLGVVRYYKPYIQANVERHDYLLKVTSDVPNTWSYIVTGDDKDSGEIFLYQWVRNQNLNKINSELLSHVNPKCIPTLFD